MNEEIMDEIKGFIPWILAAALAVGGYYGVMNYRETQKTAASEAYASAYTAEELEAAVAKFGDAKVGGALKLRLAQRYFESGRNEEALALYEALAKEAPEGFEDVPPVGRAQCLEALGQTKEALAAYEAFAEANPNSFLALTARLGSARALALDGQKDKALARLAEIRTAARGDELATARVDATEDCVKRYVK